MMFRARRYFGCAFDLYMRLSEVVLRVEFSVREMSSVT